MTDIITEETTTTVGVPRGNIHTIKKIPAKEGKADASQISAYVIYFLFSVIDILLIFRLVLKLTGANPTSGFVDFIYSVTQILIVPFAEIFPQTTTTGVVTASILEPATLVALVVYAILAFGITQVVEIMSGKIQGITLLLIVLMQLVFIPPPLAYAATTPSLGLAASFGVLAGTYTNTAPGSTINGDLGYTTGPAVAPTVNGTTHVADGTYTQAGIDQGSALSALASQPCTHIFPAGAVDLATDTSHGTIGVYTPGVYCTTATSAASIGAGGITLTGGGTYIFRIDGALTTVANSAVTLAGGASSCDVFWTPASAVTLGANSTFTGTVIAAAGVTIGSTATWTGRALAFGGTVSTTTDAITAPSCGSTTGSGSSSSSSSSSSSTGGAGICPALNNVTPIIIESRRIDSNSVFLSWGPYSGIDKFIVQYGLENGKWLYSTNVTGFSTAINDLPANQPIWVRVATRNDCSVGNYGVSKLVGGPRLPNTGFAPRENTISNIFASISELPSFFLQFVHTSISSFLPKNTEG